MPVSMVESKYNFFKKLGCKHYGVLPQSVNVHLGFKQVGFYDPSGILIKEVDLPINVNELMKPTAAPGLKQHVADMIDGVVLTIANNQSAPMEDSVPDFDLFTEDEVNEVDEEPPIEILHIPAEVQPPIKATSLKDLLKEQIEKDYTKSVPDPFAMYKPASMETVQAVMTEAPVLLKNAKRLYQPVKGTGDGTVYFVVGISKWYKIAARVKGPAVSIRIEGDLPVEKAEALQMLGFENKGHYTSSHWKVEASTPQRLIGAVLAELGGDLETPMPNIDWIINKGV